MILVHVFQAFDPLKEPSFTYPTLMPNLHVILFLIGSPFFCVFCATSCETSKTHVFILCKVYYV